jgi:hypothetical protein
VKNFDFMEHYFIVLELPGGKELRFRKGMCSPKNFWDRAAETIARGDAKIISKRKDTGVSEELRTHLGNINKFTTYVLVHMHFTTTECATECDVFNKIAQWLITPKSEVVIDTGKNFQLVTIDI